VSFDVAALKYCMASPLVLEMCSGSPFVYNMMGILVNPIGLYINQYVILVKKRRELV
jgi:hypothetical protein